MPKFKQIRNRIYSTALALLVGIGAVMPANANLFIQTVKADSVEMTYTGTEINEALKRLAYDYENPVLSVVQDERIPMALAAQYEGEEIDQGPQINQEAVNAVQASINSLSTSITAENYQTVQAQLTSIDGQFAQLTQEELALLDLSNYYMAQNSLSSYYVALQEMASQVATEPVTEAVTTVASEISTTAVIEGTTPIETEVATEPVTEPETVPEVKIDESTIDSYIQAIVWSDVAPSASVKTVSLSYNNKLVAWYVNGEDAREEAIMNGTDHFTAYDENGNPVTIYNDYLNTIYLYYNKTDKNDYVYFNSDMSHAFQNMTALGDISGLKHIRSDYVSDMSFMFAGDNSLIDISPLQAFNTASLRDVSYMFMDCLWLNNVRVFLNPHTYDSKADESRTGFYNYINLVGRYMTISDINTFATPYNKDADYESLSDSDKAYYLAPYEAWSTSSIKAEGAFANTDVDEYPDWFYLYYGMEIPKEEVVDEVETPSTEVLQEESTPEEELVIETSEEEKDTEELTEEVESQEEEIGSKADAETIESVEEDASEPAEITSDDKSDDEDTTVADDVSPEDVAPVDAEDDDIPAEEEIPVSIDEKIAEIASNIDFTSQRLIVGTDNSNVLADMPVVSSFNGIFILQFDSVEDAYQAYCTLYNKVALIEVDTGMLVAEEAVDEVITTDTVMTADENPFDELKEAISESSSISYDIALIDTGADLSANVVNAVSMIGDATNDDNGHGTKMVNFIVEQNPDARILSIKAFDASGKADISAVYAAFEYAISQNVKIINLSASAFETQDNSILRAVIQKAVANDIIVVGSAGNHGTDVRYFIPGNIEEAYIIGACDTDGERLSSSNYGDTVDYNVAADSTSEAAAKFSGFISQNGFDNIPDDILIFNTSGKTPEGEDEHGYPATYYAVDDNGLFNVDASIVAYTVAGVGDDDVLYYTRSLGDPFNMNENYVPCYCISHSLHAPAGNTYADFVRTRNDLGYIMRYGYPNNNWGLSWQEAQYLTQAAVFMAMGVDAYGISTYPTPDGDHSIYNPGNIYDMIWANGNFQIAIDLLNAANANATSADASYVRFWSSGDEYYQDLITPLPNKYDVSVTKRTDTMVNLVIHKEVLPTSDNTEFTFTVKWGPNTNYSAGSETFTLKNGQQHTCYIPAGNYYQIVESNASTSSITWVTATSDTAGSFGTYANTNAARTMTGRVPTSDVNANTTVYSYKVSGLPSGTFTVTGATTTSVSNNGTINMTGAGTFTIKDIPGSHTGNITITETRPTSGSGTWYTRTAVGNNAWGNWSTSGNPSVTISKSVPQGWFENWYTYTTVHKYYSNASIGDVHFKKSASNADGKLIVSKTVTDGPPSDYQKEFEFTITLNKAGTFSKSDGTSGNVSSGNNNFKLKHGQSITFTLPAGTTYTINEKQYNSSANEDMYTTTINNAPTTTRTTSGTIASADVSNIEYEFTITGLPSGGQYNWKIGNTTQSTKVQNNSKIKIKSGQTATIIGIPHGTVVTATETACAAVSGGTWSYASSINTTYVSSPANRKLSATVVANQDKDMGTMYNKFTPGDVTYAYRNSRNPTDTMLEKRSTKNSCTAQLVGNNMYSQTFTDAVFTVNIKDVNTGAVTTTTVSPNVNATSPNFIATRTIHCWVGDDVQMIETTAPKGYMLPSQRTPPQSNTIGYKVMKKLTSNGSIPSDNYFRFYDEPSFDPGGLAVRKGIISGAGNLVVSDNNKPVSGVVFKMEYFDNYNHSGTPVKTWYFVTNENGRFSYLSNYLADTAANWKNRDQNGNVYNDTVNRNLWLNSSAYHASDTIRANQYLYLNNDDLEDLPLGSIRISEVFAPAGYIVSTNVMTGTIRLDADNHAKFSWDSNSNPLTPISPSDTKSANFGDIQKYGSIEIHKEDVEMVKAQGDANFKNIQVTIYNNSGKEIVLGDAAGTRIANGAAICTLTFGTDGTTEDVVSTYKYFGNKDVIPIGTSVGVTNTSASATTVEWPYTVKETRTNQMYHLNENWEMQVRMTDPNPYNKDVKLEPIYKIVNGGIVNPNTNRLEADANTNTVNNQIIQGGVSFKKLDQNRAVTQDDDANLKTPQGDAILGNGQNMTEITIYNISRVVAPWDGSVVNKDNQTVATGISQLNNLKTQGFNSANFQNYIVQKVYTDADGFATTGTTDLPYGTYIAKETKKPDGYDINEDWYVIFQIREEGVVVKTWDSAMKTTQNYNANAKSGWLETAGQYSNKPVTAARAEDDIYRGGVTFTKYDEGSLTSGATERTLGKSVIGIYNISLEDVYVKNDDGEFVWSDTSKAKYDELVAADPRTVAEYFRDNVTPLFTLESDETGVFTTDGKFDNNGKDGKDETLPFGSYIAVELFQPDGYNLNEEWYVAFQIHPNKDADRGIILDTKEASNYKKDKKGDVDTTCYFDTWAGVSSKYGVSLPLDKWFYTGNSMTQTLYGLVPGEQYTLTLYGSGTVTANVNGSTSSVRMTNTTPGLYSFTTTNGIAHITLQPSSMMSNTMLTLGNGRNIDNTICDGTGQQLDMTSGKLYETWNNMVLFKYDGADNKPMSNVKFRIWTDEVADNVAIGLDKDGNRFYNNQVFTTDANGLIFFKKLFSGDNEHDEQYKHGWRIFYIQEYSDDIEGYLTDHTIKTIMVDRDGFIHEEFESDGDANITYKEAAEAYAKALTDKSVAIADQTNANQQLAAARQILAEAQAAQGRANTGKPDTNDGTANAVKYAQEQVANAEAYLNRANAAYTAATTNEAAALRAMQSAEAANNYSTKTGTAIYALNFANIHVVPFTLATGGPGTTMIYWFGGGLLAVMLGAFLFTKKRKSKKGQNVA